MARIYEFIPGWVSHRKAVIELLNTVQDEQLHYKPWKGAMSFAELVLHITGSMNMFVETVKNGELVQQTEKKSFKTVGDLKAIVIEETKQTRIELELLTDKQLNKIIDFYGTKMTGTALLTTAKDHEIHHKGQLLTYARLMGINSLPFFVIR
ncbi:damage-inducible protein DinB [Anaerobacillus alkalilacustris]|uniref:Damage-inducible protein DinB n=1 Tax=Anaerobacillus alkalilacustris TaxID=393763 RepID=A0A1S2M0Z2_9BACI|nr:DinB family protein [Anaerobacillus alkalilacustris]OIJ17627.1 damage-inducible protein DinB [Anaerobacillus alkalilacustris]